MEQLPALLSGRGKSLSGNIGEILSLSLFVFVYLGLGHFCLRPWKVSRAIKVKFRVFASFCIFFVREAKNTLCDLLHNLARASAYQNPKVVSL